MADLPPNQKQTVAKYAGNRGYFRRLHYLRGVRGWCFALAVIGSLAIVFSFRFWGSEEVFSTGPISENHARFANDCRVCHLQSENDLTDILAGTDRLTKASATTALAPASLSLMDRACIQCHPTKHLHLPQTDGLTLRTVSSELNVVHAASCASCHREHLGHSRMPASDPQRCVDCHSDEGRLRQVRRSLKLGNSPVAAAGENRVLGDGLTRFLTPPRPVGTLPAFASYGEGHPPFAYERDGAKDPAVLKFNHERHLRADIPAVNGRRLDCASCHQPGPGGVAFQPVRQQKHCAQCHSLQIQPDLPGLLIPHGDPEKVRYFLASLNVSFEYALRAGGLTDPVELARRVSEEQQKLGRRGLNTLTDLEERVFFQGDPGENRADRRPRATERKFLTECAKCHEVGPGTPSHAPAVQRPAIAERWVQHGPFTHLPHAHVACTDCHGAARTSKLTSDILLPPQKLCVECHRPADHAADLALKIEAPGDSHAIATVQRRTGGVKSDCTSCHGFHSPPDAARIIEAIANPPAKPGS